MTPAEIKDLMVATGGSASERSVALLLASGITATKDIAEALGLSQRAVQMARKRNLLRPRSQFRQNAKPVSHLSLRILAHARIRNLLRR